MLGIEPENLALLTYLSSAVGRFSGLLRNTSSSPLPSLERFFIGKLHLVL